ncbi:MAG: Eco57I restriction-modification methylase domain-containing protein [Candidatus Thorarchaeota archaeon]
MNTSLTRDQNKLTGSFYTPQDIADDIAGNSISNWLNRRTGIKTEDFNYETSSDNERQQILKSLCQIKILDPSCGEGVFLIAAGEWILNARLAMGETNDPFDIREQIAANSLYGVDIQTKAVENSTHLLNTWVSGGISNTEPSVKFHLQKGNSLVGRIKNTNGKKIFSDCSISVAPFDWYKAFPEVIEIRNGFDVVLGNPPYGNLLTQLEKSFIESSSDYDIMSGRDGTWNAASLFIARSFHLLNERGELGFLVPNSILRVKQFYKTRKFLLHPFNLWKIIDEGNPFDDVTLEMVSIFCSTGNRVPYSKIQVESRRDSIHSSHSLQRDSFSSRRIFSIYNDEIFNQIRNQGQTGVLFATRGRDIPRKHLADHEFGKFRVPYATKGRSIQRYRIMERYLKFTDDWYVQDSALSDSYNKELLVATKNYPYPRCIMKPKGIIHGGGIVKIVPLKEDINMRTIGLILNSELSKYVCTRYLTNYSELTTCLNTGIIDEFPIVYPNEPLIFASIFDMLQFAYSGKIHSSEISTIEAVADSLVYSTYFSMDNQEDLIEILGTIRRKSYESALDLLSQGDIQSEVNTIQSNSVVRGIRASPRMN